MTLALDTTAPAANLATMTTTVTPATINAPEYATAPAPSNCITNRTTHNDIVRKVSNMMEVAGAVVHNEVELVRDPLNHQKNWNVDAVATFPTIKTIVEVKPNGCKDLTHGIKQALLYATILKSDVPVVCVVTNGVDFIAFNPLNFSLPAIAKNRTKCPSVPDASAVKSLKRNRAFKALKTNKLATLYAMSGVELVRFLNATVGIA